MKKCCQTDDKPSVSGKVFNWLIITLLAGLSLLAIGQVLFA